jgi:phosphoenolpyruvate synthase/pyruvate phosphate dikinase
MVGGKAYQLSLLRARFNVPAFFVVAFADPASVHDRDVISQILREVAARGFTEMAVRSSASVEDSSEASFAGLFETVLDVSPEQLSAAVERVVSSVHGQRVADYCRARGIDHDTIRMAVIVQRQLRSRVSGVSFTRTTEFQGDMLIEACFGLGEMLVSGRVTPDKYVIDRSTLGVRKETRGYQRDIALAGKGGKGEIESLPFHKRNARKLTDDEVLLVAKTSLDVEAALGFGAADIEWAFEDDMLFILQARPYTGFAAEKGPAR